MTRCKNCCYNDHLKSSVYNPNGQRYELQLTAYNAMTNHLRRVLLAKSVVDCGNKRSENFLKNKNVKCKRTAASARGVKESVSQNIVDRLADDTKNHPHVSASMNFILNCNKRSNNYIEMKNKRSNSAESNEGSGVRESPRFSQTKIYKGELRAGSPARKTITTRSPQPQDRVSVSTSGGDKIIDNRDSDQSKVLTKSKSEDALNMKNFRAVVPCVSSNSDISFPKTPEYLRSTTKINFDKLCNENSQLYIVNSENDNDSIYVKFVYEITKEIMDRGYYEDRDIEMVFEKHVKKNFYKLKKEKMFEEIKFLKKSFGMNCDYKEEEEEEEEEKEEENCSKIISTENYFNRSYNKQDSDPESGLKKGIIFSKKISVKKLNDPDKETLNNSTDIIVSQEEAFKTLLEMNFDKEKAEEIVKSLKNRSKEIVQYFSEGKINELVE